jgi:hypothetical protein
MTTLVVALIGLGGVNLVFLQVSPKFITTFPMLPDPVPYLEFKSLLLRRRVRFLATFFLITFSSGSNFLLNYVKDCFKGLGFFLSFLEARKSYFSIPSFSNQWQSLVLCVLYPPPCFLQRLQCFPARAFFMTLAVVSVPGCFVPFFSLCKAFSLRKELDLLDLSWLHTRSIALRDKRSKCISTGVPPFL